MVRKTIAVVGPRNSGKTALLTSLLKSRHQWCSEPMTISSNGGGYSCRRNFGSDGYRTLVMVDVMVREQSGLYIERLIDRSDIVLITFDGLSSQTLDISLEILQQVKAMGKPAIMVTTKCDDGPVFKGKASSSLPHFNTSAFCKTGLQEMEERLWKMAFPDLCQKNEIWERLNKAVQDSISSFRSVRPIAALGKAQAEGMNRLRALIRPAQPNKGRKYSLPARKNSLSVAKPMRTTSSGIL